jgi:hypothetical protein
MLVVRTTRSRESPRRELPLATGEQMQTSVRPGICICSDAAAWGPLPLMAMRREVAVVPRRPCFVRDAR